MNKYGIMYQVMTGFFALLCGNLILIEADDLAMMCSNPVYCNSELLKTIQLGTIFNNSKHFVDLPLSQPVKKTMADWAELTPSQKRDETAVNEFINSHFSKNIKHNNEVWKPGDFTENPKFMEQIADKDLKNWAHELNKLWVNLGVKVNAQLKTEPEQHSLIWLPNPYIVSTADRRELTYWESYVIVHGLLLCEMKKTAKGMLENFLYLLDKFGYVPSGSRVYQLHRSQPPLLIPMMKLYFDFTKDKDFVRKNIALLEKEYAFWTVNRTMIVRARDGRYFRVAGYRGGNWSLPRPEAFKEDTDLAMDIASEEYLNDVYVEIDAVAETGWGISSRFSKMTYGFSSSDAKKRVPYVSYIAPVDLNAYVCWMSSILGDFHKTLGNKTRVEYYKTEWKGWTNVLNDLLWAGEIGSWADYDSAKSRSRLRFAASNFAPLWTGCYDKKSVHSLASSMVEYFYSNHILENFPRGVPVFIRTLRIDQLSDVEFEMDQPWSWPFYQYLIVQALHNSGEDTAVALAQLLAEQWVRTTYEDYENNKKSMFEKYHTIKAEKNDPADRRETGAACANAVVFAFLEKYGSKLLLGTRETKSRENRNKPLIGLIAITSFFCNLVF